MAESGVPGASLSAASEPAFDIICQPCHSEGTHAEAEGYCIDCCEHLCVHCIGGHKRYAGLKHHLLLNKAEMPNKQDISHVRDVCIERCQIHRDEIIKYFCPVHKVLGCNVCITLKHSRCDDVSYIPEVAQGFEDSRDFMEFMAKLNGLTEKSKSTTKFAEESKTRASDCYDRATHKIDAYRQDLVDAIDRQIQHLKYRAKQIHTKDTGKMNTLADDSKTVLAELQSISLELGSLQEKKHFCQMFVEMKNKEERLTELRGRLEDLESDYVSGYDFQPDDQVPTVIRRKDGVGQLVMKSSKKSDSVPKEKFGSLPQAISGPLSEDNPGLLLEAKSNVKADGKKLQQRRATQVSNISVKSTGDDKNCHISGIALLSAEQLVAADCSNKKIKLIDIPNKKVMSEFKPDGEPWDVTVCEGEVAATLPNVRKIIFLKCHDGLVLARDIRVKGQCRSIDYSDGKLFVIYDKQKKLEVITMTGTVIQMFDKNDQGRKLFLDPTYVTVSAVNQSIYVSEWSEGRVTVLGMDGKVKGECKYDELGLPRKLAVDSTGVMYLCDSGYDAIHLLSPPCKKEKILLKHKNGLVSPYSVCYCESTGMLYVGMQNHDHIKVYRIF